MGAGQAGEGEGAEKESEVAQGDVAVAADEQQVEDDAAEPVGDEKAAEARGDENDEAGDDLDDADHVHGVTRRMAASAAATAAAKMEPALRQRDDRWRDRRLERDRAIKVARLLHGVRRMEDARQCAPPRG
jgi:hypothetical protein